MKSYLGKYQRGKNKGTYGISFVLQPAMEQTFIALKEHEQEIKLKVVDEEKRIVIGLVLEPNKPVYRNQGGEEFTLSFEEKDIESMCHDFTLFNNNSNSTIEHDKNNQLKNVWFAENWIVRDEKIDTAVAYGLSPKIGSWMSIAKIENDNLWEDIKLGKVKGFSIDAMLSLEEVNLKSHIEMSKSESLLERILLAITPKQKEIKLGKVKVKDTDIVIEFEGEEPMVGASVWMTASDETRVPVPVGEYVIDETGVTYVVKEEGILAEIMPPMTDAPENTLAEMGEDGKVSNDAKIASEIESAIKSILIKYTEQDVVIGELKAELAQVKNELVEFGKAPASKGIKQPDTNFQVDLSKMTSKERIAFRVQQSKL